MAVNGQGVRTLETRVGGNSNRKVTFGEYVTTSGYYKIEGERAYSVNPGAEGKPEIKELVAYQDEGIWKPVNGQVFARYSTETSRSQRG